MTIKLPKRLQLPIKEQLNLFIKEHYDAMTPKDLFNFVHYYSTKEHYDAMTPEDLFNFVHYYLTKEYNDFMDKEVAKLYAESSSHE
jgi:uncharacterized protein (DUF433 family)